MTPEGIRNKENQDGKTVLENVWVLIKQHNILLNWSAGMLIEYKF
jgi:hypothetical protein